MMAALPDKAPAKPLKPRKISSSARAAGFVHSSIPLAAKFVEAAGTKTGAWTATITYDAADINTANLQQYDAVVLDSTTGCFLDDPNDKAATDARRAALLAFIRGGKGIAAIHATTDSYHGLASRAGGGAAAAAAAAGRRPRWRAPMIAQGDTNADQQLSRAELNALADAWFDKLDPEKTGRVGQPDFGARFASLLPPPAAAARRAAGGAGAAAAASRSGPSGTRSSAAISSSTGTTRSSSRSRSTTRRAR